MSLRSWTMAIVLKQGFKPSYCFTASQGQFIHGYSSYKESVQPEDFKWQDFGRQLSAECHLSGGPPSPQKRLLLQRLFQQMVRWGKGAMFLRLNCSQQKTRLTTSCFLGGSLFTVRSSFGGEFGVGVERRWD